MDSSLSFTPHTPSTSKLCCCRLQNTRRISHFSPPPPLARSPKPPPLPIRITAVAPAPSFCSCPKSVLYSAARVILLRPEPVLPLFKTLQWIPPPISFWLRRTSCGILVQPGMEPRPPAVETPTPNHWTAKGFPGSHLLRSKSRSPYHGLLGPV